MKEILKKLLGSALGISWMKPVLVAIVLTLVLVAVVFYGCGPDKDSKLEKEIDQKAQQTVRKDAEADTAEKRVEEVRSSAEEKEKPARDAVRRAGDVRRERLDNTSYQDANAERCRAYPDSRECGK